MKQAAIGMPHFTNGRLIDRQMVTARCRTLMGAKTESAVLVIDQAARRRRECGAPCQPAHDRKPIIADPPRDAPGSSKKYAKVGDRMSHHRQKPRSFVRASGNRRDRGTDWCPNPTV